MRTHSMNDVGKKKKTLNPATPVATVAPPHASSNRKEIVEANANEGGGVSSDATMPTVKTSSCE